VVWTDVFPIIVPRAVALAVQYEKVVVSVLTVLHLFTKKNSVIEMWMQQISQTSLTVERQVE
jgi:hypothetical protein